ncbi:hypothetical protein [Thioalkalivibrio sp. ALE23]|uniref:hypothetical protein n=1 Tax=Thioalkalivibrio sp. ALE23 TaxID=1265495 RepID=UPI00039BA386|nr:hypothetical protein [Thioalkalivibrio sp. ALE23]
MFRNQYLVCRSSQAAIESADFSWSGYGVFLGQETECATSCDCSVLIIGVAVDYSNTDAGLEDIANGLAGFNSVADVIARTDRLTGRYVIFFSVQRVLYAISDACSLKRVLFGEFDGNAIITSSEMFYYHLFGDEPVLEEEVSGLLGCDDYLKKERPWFGLRAYDGRFSVLLPNTFLDLDRFEVLRQPPPAIEMSKKQVVEQFRAIVSGAIQSLALKRPLMLAVTAGVDSRILLALSLKYKERIRYYVFNRAEWGSGEAVDVVVPRQIFEDLGIPFDVIAPAEADACCLERLESDVSFPRVLPKTRNICYHFHNSDSKVVNLNGNAAGVFRAFYGHQLTNKVLPVDSLAYLSGTQGCDLLKRNIGDWHGEAVQYSRDSGIDLASLFYWEQRMPHWGSEYPLEQDIAIEEVSPYNNRYLLFMMMSLPPAWRVGARPKYFKAVLDGSDLDLSGYPVNRTFGAGLGLGERFRSVIWRYLLARVVYLRARRFVGGVKRVLKRLRNYGGGYRHEW